MAELFDLGTLSQWLQDPQVTAEREATARRVASGWLRNATGLAAWPDPVPDDLFAWGFELAAIALRNPAGFATSTSGAVSVTWDRLRRDKILEDAWLAYNADAKPQSSFPKPDWSWKATTSTTTPN